ncbi:MAG: amidohydrolase family protein, partial [Planctomycetota bacterium]
MILKAAWIAPVVTPPIRAGWVAIMEGRIVALGTGLPPAEKFGPVTDLGETILTPGLVNPHTHLELTTYAGQLPPDDFWIWIARLVRLRAAPGRVARERKGVRDGARQTLQAGVTCVGDISRENVAWQELKPLPIRKVCFVELLSLADLPPRNPHELREGVTAIQEDELLTAGITPHAPYTVPADQLRAAIQIAHELNRPWCTHWAETREEIA